MFEVNKIFLFLKKWKPLHSKDTLNQSEVTVLLEKHLKL